MNASTRMLVTVVALSVAAGFVAVEVLTSTAPSPCTGIGPPGSVLLAAPAAPALSPQAAQDPLAAQPRVVTFSAIGPLQVVAAENFWGGLVAQLGGNQTSVLSIVTDPNADPHEYEANATIARAVAHASLVVVNGVGYDDWALQLVAAAAAPGQLLVNAGTVNGVSVGGGLLTGNPHLWYNPVYVNRTLAAVYNDLVTLRPGAAPYFQANYGALNTSLGAVDAHAVQIRQLYAGTPVAATEDIFVYAANYTGLELVSPAAFMEAVAEGNDPPTPSVVQFECQLENGQVRVLVYNEQTVTPLTTTVRSIAQAHGVAIVGFTETVAPSNATFQVWMGAQYTALENALNLTAGA